MNSNGTTGSIPIIYQNANPLLYTLQQDHTTIQPYWIIVLQLLASQFLERLKNLVIHGVPLTTLEIGFMYWLLEYQIKLMREVEEGLENVPNNVPNIGLELLKPFKQHVKESEVTRDRFLKKLRFDLFDFVIHGLSVIGHAIWYCYIQSSCMSADKATPWNCYNIFGYRLFNYIFVSYATFSTVYFVKILALRITNFKMPKTPSFGVSKIKHLTWVIQVVKWLSFYLGLWLSTMAFLFTGALILPYLFTHVIPMVFTYPFMTIVYFSLWSVICISTVFIVLEIPIIRKLIYIHHHILDLYHRVAAALIIIAFGVYTYPILLTTLFNYSQYLYYGENYIYTMSNEFNSRDDQTYFAIFRNSINERLHSLLNFF